MFVTLPDLVNRAAAGRCFFVLSRVILSTSCPFPRWGKGEDHCAVLLEFKLRRTHIAQRNVSSAGPDVNLRNTLQKHWHWGRE
jgi:hypothetical protein